MGSPSNPDALAHTQAYAPLEVSYRASMKLATLQTPAVADVNAVARKCVALSKCMLQSGAVETGLDLLADELSCFILLEWDASPISEELVRAWRKTGSNGLWTWIQSRLSSSVAQTPVLRLVVKALQQEVIQSAGAENLVKELELAVGKVSVSS